MPERFHLRLTHKLMAICLVGRLELVAFAALHTALPLPSESNGLKFEHGKFLNLVCVV